MPIYSPLEIPSCSLWLDASDLTTLSALSADSEPGNYLPVNNGDLIGFIKDKSGNNRDFTNYTIPNTSFSPVLLNNAQNGRPVIRFNGNSFLTSTYALAPSAQTVFVVSSLRNTPNAGVSRIFTQVAGNHLGSSDSTEVNHFIPVTLDGDIDGEYSSFLNSGYRGIIQIAALSSFDCFTSSFSSNSRTNFVYTYLDGLSSSFINTSVPFLSALLGYKDRDINVTRIGADLRVQKIIPYAWYDASDSSSILLATGNEIATWKDKSGNGYDLTSTGISPNLPLYNTSSINGLNTVANNLSSGFLNSNFFLSGGGTSQIYVAFVGRLSADLTSFPGNSAFLFDSPSPGRFFTTVYNPSLSSIRVGETGSNAFFINNPNSTVNTTISSHSFLVTIHHRGTGTSPRSYLKINGNVLPVSASANFLGSLSGLVLGNSTTYAILTTNRGFYGDIGEVIFLPGNITSSAQSYVEGYLAHKWGLSDKLPTDHLYKTSGPASLTSILVDTSLPTNFTFLTGDVGEVIMYDRFLSKEERSSVEYYLSQKWDLPFTVYATNSGNFSDASIWSISGVPLSSYNVYSNGFQINLDGNITVGSLRGTTIPAAFPQNVTRTTGTFNLLSSFSVRTLSGIFAGTANGLLIRSNDNKTISLTSNVIGGAAANSHGISLSSINYLTNIYGNITGGTNATAYGISLFGETETEIPDVILNIYGDVYGNTGNGVVNNTTDFVGITGNIIRGGNAAAADGVTNTTAGGFYINSNILGGTNSTAYGYEQTGGYLSLVGNISASQQCNGINSTGGLVEVRGNIVATSGFNGYSATGTRSNLACSFINAINGRQAVFATSFTVPSNLNQYTSFDRRYLVTNLLSSSETFSTPNWSQPFGGVVINPGASFSPTLVLNATELRTNGTTNIFAIRRHFVSTATNNLPYTFSIYAQPRVGYSGNLELYVITPTRNYGAVFDLTTQSVLTATDFTIADVCCYEPVSDYSKYSITFRLPASQTNFVEIRLTDSTSLSQQVIGNDLRFYIWGAQLTQTGTEFGYASTDTVVTSPPANFYSPGSFAPTQNYGEDIINFYDSNVYSASNLPDENNVRRGVPYGGFNTLGIVSSLTGNMVVPVRESVKYGTLVDNTTGDALFTPGDASYLWNAQTANIVAEDSIGLRVKNIATTFDVGSALNDMFI
jgi:hypothetical protein